MPQTREHLAIIELLGVRDGVVALTKADIVDDELLELAEADVREFLARTSFAGCEVVTVSARDGRGTAELLAALERAAERTEAGRRSGPARLPVDRVFPLKGIGTVVTGTLWAGEIEARDALAVEPGGARAVVRSVQVHDHEAEVVHAGSRAGVNLRGVDRGDVARGDWLVAPALAGLSGRRFDAWVSVATGSPRAALGRPRPAASRHGAVPRSGGAARGTRDRARRRRAGGRPAGRRRARPAARPLHPALALAGRDDRRRGGAAGRRSPLARPRAPRRAFSPRCAAATRPRRSRRWRRTAGRRV